MSKSNMNDQSPASLTQEQTIICNKNNATPLPPLHDQMIVISDGVFEGECVEGVRYPSPKHMTGWWLTTQKYNGDTSTLRVEHYYHLPEKRPDLIKYLALPFGFRFFQKDETVGREEEIWKDDNVERAD